VTVRANQVGVNISSLVINAVGSLNATNNVALSVIPAAGASYNNIGSITRLGVAQLWIGDVVANGSITGNITASRVGNIEANGTISGNIIVQGIDTSSVARAAIIDRLRSLNGNITGDITLDHPGLTANERPYVNIDAPNGTIGTAADPVNFSIGGDIQLLSGQSIFGTITSRRGNFSGDTWSLRATSGEFSGSLTTTNIKSSSPNPNAARGVFVSGNMDANVTLTGGVVDEQIVIGGTFNSGKTITTPASGLTDQIVINNLNQVGNNWSGTVTVGTDTLVTANYATPNATLGNGSVGLVPFRLHNDSSVPANQSFLPGTPPRLADPTSVNDITDSDFRNLLGQGFRPIVLEFYGPIKLPSSGPPVRVTLVSVDCTSPFDFTEVFSFSIQTPAVGGPAAPRRLIITANPNPPPGKFVLPGTYQVTMPDTGGLLCDIAPSTSNVRVADFFYNFRLYNDCDLNGTPFLGNSNVIDANCASTGYCDPIDFNRNGVYPEDEDVIDFFDVLAGAPCPYAGICDIDFNNNTVFPEDADVIAFFDVLAGGGCVTCFPN
jgi:hypothetical protein